MKRKHLSTGFLIACSISLFAQAPQRDLQYWRAPGQPGLNVFESPKVDTVPFTGTRVRVGGDFALQFQGLSHDNENGTLIGLSNNFTLPTANLNLDVQLEDGVRMHLRTYLSSRHHAQPYVKGGYLQIDKLDFIQEDLMAGLMEMLTIKVGMDEINYGDAHFRRSDNARAIYNPFVGNYIMDAFTTEPFLEFTVRKSSFLGVAGVSNGRLNQAPVEGDDGFVAYGKLGYDRQMNEDLRLRLTASVYHSTSDGTRDYLYAGDRAGGRYYRVLEDTAGSAGRTADFLPRFNPGFIHHTAFQVNPFVKFKGLEFFGVYEMTFGDQQEDVSENGVYTQLGAELIYRFGGKEQYYAGGRYNYVTGEDNDNDGTETKTIDRFNLGAGWFMTRNILLKGEYVRQTHSDDGFLGTQFENAEFDGFVIEAVVSF